MDATAQDLTLKLNVDEINYILAVIAKRPLEEALGIHNKIQKQARQALQPPPADPVIMEQVENKKE